jgi:putative endonuclease
MTIHGGTVYILTNKYHTVFYVGVASSVSNRVEQHREKLYPKSFTAKYNIEKLVYYETYDTIEEAIAREKQIKKYSKFKKTMLIISKNPQWNDLYAEVKYL